MYRLNYTNLNKKQVEDIVAKGKAPVCASEFCTRLTGKKLKIVLDKQQFDTPTLEYDFKSATKLTLVENGGASVECDYGAQTLKCITLFSHMIPGTKKGYNVIVNWETTVVTVVEMWFFDYEGQKIDTTQTFFEMMGGKIEPFDNREVQRQYYLGYFEEQGKTPPSTRDKLSLRLENCMIEWREDRGKHRLSTYTTTLYTTMVELDTPDGGDVLTFAADILQISDTVFIHSFGEVEYSGRLSVEVIDLFSTKKIGVTMGIDENDEFEHTVYKGHGKFLGRYSTYFDFNDKGDQYSDFMKRRLDSGVKGTRATYRPSVMSMIPSDADIAEASKNALIFDEERAKARAATMSSSHILDDSAYCVGKAITFRGDDGLVIDVKFKSVNELEYRLDGDSKWGTERYCAFELDEDFIIFAFYRMGSIPPENYVFALDFKNGCATCISSKMNSKYDKHDPVPGYHFGVFETEGLTPLRIFRHGFTDELLGRAFTQTYSDAMSSIHIYNAPHSYSWTIINNADPGTPANRAGGAVWSSPCEYLKFRDNLYAMIWVEQKWSGHMDALFRNLRTARDAGFGYGISYDGKVIAMDRMGAVSRPAGSINLSHIYSLRNYDTMS